MTLADLVRQAAPLADIARHLDEAGPRRRAEETLALDRAEQRLLFERADPATTLDDLVPAGTGALAAIRHEGRNTLPLPSTHKRFAKVFCRPSDGTARLFGYNDAPSSRLIGPGYFVAHATAGNPQWEQRGAIVVDYYLVPDAPVPEGWPRVISNSRGLQFFVYRGTRDFMRRVSKDVTIGAAYRGEKALDHYFVLVRE